MNEWNTVTICLARKHCLLTPYGRRRRVGGGCVGWKWDQSINQSIHQSITFWMILYGSINKDENVEKNYYFLHFYSVYTVRSVGTCMGAGRLQRRLRDESDESEREREIPTAIMLSPPPDAQFRCGQAHVNPSKIMECTVEIPFLLLLLSSSWLMIIIFMRCGHKPLESANV